jgi:hypothetical protein
MMNDYWQPYPEPYRRQPVPGAPTNGFAIASLVCGIAGGFIVFPIAIAAIVLGHIARREIGQTGERGMGMATAGLMLGYFGLVIGILLLGAFIIGVMALGSWN